jgi:hypothetical protein
MPIQGGEYTIPMAFPEPHRKQPHNHSRKSTFRAAMKGKSMIEPGPVGPLSRSFLIALALILALMIAPRAGHAAAMTQPIGMHVSMAVLSGPDAGVQIDGFLSLTPGTGAQWSGTLSTLAGALMGQVASYTPISATATMSQSGIKLSLDLSNLSAPSGSMAIPALEKLAIPHFANLGTHAAIQGSGRAFADGSYGGSFTGPAATDSGSWTAAPAVAHDFALSAKATMGPKWSLSGQAAVVFGADGSISGLYISDDFKNIYPVHGVTGNNWLSLVLPLGKGQILYGNASTDPYDGYQIFKGTFYGPTTTTSGTWSAGFTS